jgi:plasmid stabilization system protein ParE
MPTLKWSALARQDIDHIYDYIGEHERRPAIADKFVRELVAECESLAKTFAAGFLLGTARPNFGQSIRVFSHKRWVIVFRPIGNGIEVLRVIDGSRDYDKLFGS